eukprot:tig00020999_g16977.t1
MEGRRAPFLGPLAGLFLRFCIVAVLALGLVAASFAVVVAATRAQQRRGLLSIAILVTQYGTAALAALSVELAVAQTPIGAPFWRGGFRQVQMEMGRIAQTFLANGTNAILFGGSVLRLPGTIGPPRCPAAPASGAFNLDAPQKANGAAAAILNCGAPEDLAGSRLEEFFPSLRLAPRDRRLRRACAGQREGPPQLSVSSSRS